MSKSILNNIQEADQLLRLETETLSGYVLEHLHACGGNPLKQGNSLPHNLANGLALRYPHKKDQVYKKIIASCHWLINNGYLDIINSQGFFEISTKGNKLSTAADFDAQLNPSEGSKRGRLAGENIKELEEFLEELNAIRVSLQQDGYPKNKQRFDRWKRRVVSFISDHFGVEEARSLSRHEMLDTLTPQIARTRINHTMRTFSDCQAFLEVLIDDVKTHGERVVSQQLSAAALKRDKSDGQSTSTEISPARKTTYNFPLVQLSDSELMWLRIISNQFLKGYLPNVDELKKSLHAQGKWPQNFKPSEIDYRLFQKANIPTLLGIWHADPESNWISKLDELIRYIKARLPNTTNIKVEDIAKGIGLSELNVSILIHLLPSLGLYYTAIGKPTTYKTVVIPGQLGIYDILRLDDPEKMDGYLEYDNLENQVRTFYGAESPSELPITEVQRNAEQLYAKVKSLVQNAHRLDEDTARVVVESADDAIKEFGSTSQEKKVELRKWKLQAESVLTPATVEELRKRAERQLLIRSYPRNTLARRVLLALVGLAIVVGAVVAVTGNLTKLMSLFSASSKPSSNVSQLAALIEVTNGGKERVEIEELCEFFLTENKGMMIQEYPAGRGKLLPIDSSNPTNQYSLNAGESRFFRLPIPSVRGYDQLLERGAANIHFSVRIVNSKQFSMGSIPFQRDTLNNYRVSVKINEPE